MPHDLITIITTSDPAMRDRSLDGFCRTADAAALCDAARALDAFRRRSENLYERVRATFFLAAIYRYHLPGQAAARAAKALVPFEGYTRLLGRRFEEAIDEFRAVEAATRPQRRHRQRPGRRLSGPGLSNPGRPGPPQRPLGPRQPVDVPHGPSGRPSAGDPPGAEAPRGGGAALPDPRRADGRPHGPLAQRLERHLLPGHGFSPRGPRAERLGRPGRPRPRRPAAAADRGLAPRHRPAGAPPDEHRPEVQGRHHRAGRRLRFRQGLPRAAQGGRDRRRHHSRRAGRLRPDAGRRAGPTRRAGAGAGNRQQGERYPQGLPPGRLDEPAGGHHHRLHAGDRPDPVAHRQLERSRNGSWSPRGRSWANGWAAPAADGRIPAASGPA